MKPERKRTDRIKRAKQKRKLQLSQKTRRQRGISNNFDWITFGLFALLLGISLIVMSTASTNAIPDDPHFYLRRHALMMCGGFAAFVVLG